MTEFALGQIIQFAGSFAIKGTALCNGQLLSINQNQALFSVLGTTYGGDGRTTFALPNLQGRSMVHQGTGVANNQYTIGQVAGATTAILNANTLPAHSHAIAGTLSVSGLQPHAADVAPAPGSVLGHAVDVSGNNPKAAPAIYCPSGTTATVPLGGLNVVAAATGGSQSFSILNPYLTITCLIFLTGIFPSRN